MNLRQIEAFRAVMLTGSATAAAKVLFITQPAVSRLISDLEHQTKLILFTRLGNRLQPTPEAQTLYQDVHRAFIGLDEIKQSAYAIAHKKKGSLRLVAMPLFIKSFMPKLIAQFARQYPNVSIELENAPRIQALDAIRSQRLDLAIVSLGHKEELGLKVQTFCEQKAVCVLPKGHPLCEKEEIHARDLQNQPYITLSRGSPFRTRFDQLFATENINQTYTIETRTQATVYDLVKQGAGISILDPLATNSRDTEVVVKPFLPEVSWQYAIVQSHHTTPSVISQAFIALFMDYVAQSDSFSANPPKATR